MFSKKKCFIYAIISQCFKYRPDIFLKVINHKTNDVIKKKNITGIFLIEQSEGAIHWLIILLRNTLFSNIMTYYFTEYALYSNHIALYLILQMCSTLSILHFVHTNPAVPNISVNHGDFSFFFFLVHQASFLENPS